MIYMSARDSEFFNSSAYSARMERNRAECGLPGHTLSHVELLAALVCQSGMEGNFYINKLPQSKWHLPHLFDVIVSGRTVPTTRHIKTALCEPRFVSQLRQLRFSQTSKGHASETAEEAVQETAVFRPAHSDIFSVWQWDIP
jgi:hypothetical protein